jgi:predicted ArsR family transcriptional regulator
MPASSPSDERILLFLKFRGSQPTEAIARHLGISLPGARKHLAALGEAGLIDFSDETGSVGRPRRTWHLTRKAQTHFPDTHALLTIDLIRSVRATFGPDGMDRLVAERERAIDARYRKELAGIDDIETRVARLAELRDEEGYMAEWSRLPEGGWLLTENHCPICAAAQACQGFCRSELETFREALGARVAVERTEHIVTGARRCAYHVAPVAEDVA